MSPEQSAFLKLIFKGFVIQDLSVYFQLLLPFVVMTLTLSLH